MGARDIYNRVLGQLVRCIHDTREERQPFSHAYFLNLFPTDIYWTLLESLPDPSMYSPAAERHYGVAGGGFVRSMYALTTDGVDRLVPVHRELWRGVAAALTAPELKQAVFARLAPDLANRYGVAGSAVPDLAGFTRPTLYRETDGFEIPPHPDTRKKVVTMQLYLPADLTQLGLGTALYRRKLGWPLGGWRRRFEQVKQFDFRPNSGYAFVVNNTLTKKSWHGREQLPEGAGVRNTLLNTFYETPRDGFSGYLPEESRQQRRAA